MKLTLQSASIFMISVSIASTSFAGVPEALKMLDAGDVAGAAAEFQSAYEANDGDGAFYLGRLFEQGIGTEADPVRAANLYAAGVEKGSTLSMLRLGGMYLEGLVLLRDYAEATRLFCQAADAGNADGQLNCGLAYQTGRGADVDISKAVSNYELSASQGNIAAKNLLGQLYMTGEGVEKDTDKALSYFEDTADTGNPMGLYQLSLYQLSLDNPDKALAYSYANLAAVRGLQEAVQLRAQLEGEMTSAEITKAQALSKSWTEERIANSKSEPSPANDAAKPAK